MAAALHLAFVEDVCRLSRGVAGRRVLSVAGETSAALVALARREGMEVEAQGEGDLGERMERAITGGLRSGAARVAIVGSDVPSLPPHLLANALALLRAADVVLGPADDGGYWLVGARCRVPWLFAGVPWGTEAVLAASEERLRERGVAYGMVERHFDVDRPDDLRRLERALAEDPGLAPATRAALSRR